MQSARQSLKFFRSERKAAVRQYAGAHWSEEASKEKVHVNLLSLYVSVVSRNLIAKAPRVMMSTYDRASKSTVAAMQDWANKEIEHINLANTLQRVVLDALFSIGICKVALATPGDAASLAWNVQAGSPIASRVDLDDFVYDIHARDFSEVSFIGHRYRVPLDTVRDSKLYNKSRKNLTASNDHRFNQEGDERVNVLNRGYVGDDEEMEDMVDLWEVYVPRHRCIYTLHEDCLSGASAPQYGGQVEALREQDWIGPDTGPYHILGYGTIPGNCMPKGPIQDLIDLHLPLNLIMRKLIRQAERQKDLTLVQRGGDGDAERYRNANDGELVPTDNPANAKQVSMGGPNQVMFQFFLQLKDLFSWMAGNLDIMGGLSPQAKTATQDSMLDKNSTRAIADMQERTIAFSASVLKAMGWFWWHDPMKIMRSTYQVPGMPDTSAERYVYPAGHPDPSVQRRDGNWEDMDLKVDPYSMQHQTPQQRAGDLMKIVTSVYMPMAQIAQQQGVGFDFNAFIEIMSGYMDMPDMQRILATQEKPKEESAQGGGGGGGGQEAGPGPAETTRTYVRENMPGRTRQGNDMNMMNALAGVDAGGASQNGAMQ